MVRTNSTQKNSVKAGEIEKTENWRENELRYSKFSKKE